jgi:DNA-binding YbaB/EbfC family protein
VNQQQQMMRQLAQMQANVAKAQEEIAAAEVSATAGGGTITVVASGTGVIRSIRIDPAAVDPDDVEMLEDLVVAAVNEARRQAEALSQEKMAAATGGLGAMAGGLGLPGF